MKLVTAILLGAAACLLSSSPVARAECFGPDSFGASYSLETSAEGYTPKIDNGAVVVTVKHDTTGDCSVQTKDQFAIEWESMKDMALVRLVRNVPKECMGLLGAATSEGEEVRVALPEDLSPESFKRMMLALPPGGMYESYLLFDNTAVESTAGEESEEPHLTLSRDAEDGEDAAAAVKPPEGWDEKEDGAWETAPSAPAEQGTPRRTLRE